MKGSGQLKRSPLEREEKYSRTSMARTLMALHHGCFELVFESVGKNPIAADLG